MPKLTKHLTGDQLSFAVEPQPCQTHARHLVLSRSSVTTTPVFDTYWHFAAERQNIFFRRALGCLPPWSSDPIFLRFRFTNVYRVADRVSQFLVRHVQADGPQDHHSLFFRT